MTRVDTTESAILEAITTRLRTELSLGARTCYVSVEPLAPLIPLGGPWFVAVSLRDGFFEPGEQAVFASILPGNTTEAVDFTVTVYVRMAIDSAQHAVKRLSDATRGLLTRKAQVLKALVGWDLLTASGGSATTPRATLPRRSLGS